MSNIRQFEIGDVVYYLQKNQIIPGKVTTIGLQSNGDYPYVSSIIVDTERHFYMNDFDVEVSSDRVVLTSVRNIGLLKSEKESLEEAYQKADQLKWRVLSLEKEAAECFTSIEARLKQFKKTMETIKTTGETA